MSESCAAFAEPPATSRIMPERIGVLTAYTPNLAEYGNIAAENRRAYAARHGYALHVYTNGFDPSRPASWSKICFVRRALRHYTCVLWTDADALIMNRDITIPSLLVPRCDVLLTQARAPFPHINCGNMLFRSSPFSRLFLELTWRLSVFTHDSTWEQRAINYLVQHYRFERLKVVPNRAFNSYGHVENDPDPYQPGDFIIHFPGVANRISYVRRYAALAS